ncbi:MAG: glucuronoxylanase, partial [Terracidiphilus sp.]
MLKKIICAAAVSLCLGLSALAGGQTSSVNFNTTYQTIHGFGGSTAWTGVLSTAQANGAWGTTGSQLGLTINRARIDPGGQANWGTELANAKLATSYGAIEFATPWTPPASMKSNNNVDDGSLNTNEYGAFATYLESFVTYMANNGVDLYAISMQNEPNFLPSYESCGWTP